MKPRTKHWNVFARHDSPIQRGRGTQKRQLPQQHRDYWDGQLDLLNGTINARRRLRIESTRVGEGVALKWRTGGTPFDHLVVYYALPIAMILVVWINDISQGFRLVVTGVSVVVLIIAIGSLFLSVSKTHSVVLRQGDPAVEWLLNAVSVKEKRRDRRAILRELAQCSYIETVAGKTFVQKLMAREQDGA